MRKTAPPWPVLLNATIFLALLFATGAATKAQAKLESVYSDLSESKCQTIEVDKETGSSTQRCPGIGGYKLLVHDDDARQSTLGGNSHWQKSSIGFLAGRDVCVFQCGDQGRVARDQQ